MTKLNIKRLILTTTFCRLDTVELEKLPFTIACFSNVNSIPVINCQTFSVSIVLR